MNDENLGYLPYIAGDCETLGLDRERSPITEIAFILDDGRVCNSKGLESLPFVHAYVDHEKPFEYAEPYATMMAADYFESLFTKADAGTPHTPVLPKHNVAVEIGRLFTDCAQLSHTKLCLSKEFDPKKLAKGTEIQICGKNFESADWAWINNPTNFKGHEFLKMVDYKFLDIGAMASNYTPDGRNPSLSIINGWLGRKEVAHTAYADALDVVFARRYFWCKARGYDYEALMNDGVLRNLGKV